SALGSALADYAPGKRVFMQRFWDHSLIVAQSAGFIAGKIYPHLAELSYLAGLFHDCGIPLLLKKYGDYGECAGLALGPIPQQAFMESSSSIVVLEDQKYRTNHAITGYLVAKAWHLPSLVPEAVCFHHDSQSLIPIDPSIRQIVSLIMLAEFISCPYDTVGMKGGYDFEKWTQSHSAILSNLDLTQLDVSDLKEDLYHFLYAHENT
ncbi:MAG: HDOD domain-containing protein, partial [Syntrophales bacterium LBB04]|nr:HDOD domain-containing protein [Syntrophales bacterium LBB04]